MFNKPFKVKSNSATKGADKKRLQKKLVQMFPTISETAVGSMVPSKMAVQTAKLVTHSEETVLVFVVDGEPLFVDNDGCIFPTVYALWKWPYILGYITTWPPVLKKLQNGASLMLPGVVLPENSGMDFRSLEKDQLCAVNIAHNMSAVCVGITTMSGSEMLANKMKGKGVTTIHCYGDHLWSMGSKTELPHINMPLKDSLEDLESSSSMLAQQKVASGNSDVTDYDESQNFMSQLSLKLDSLHKDETFDLVEQSPLQELGSLPPPNVDKTEHSDNVASQDPALLLSDTEKHSTDGVHLLEDSLLSDKTPSDDVHLLEEHGDSTGDQVVHSKTIDHELVVQTATFDTLLEHTTPLGSMYSNDTSMPPEEHDPRKAMDTLLLNCFLHSLKHRVTAGDLPMLTSTFYKAHMIPSCPEGLTLDVKKSSYKKLSQFLKDMQLRSIVEVKELTQGVDSIVSFDRTHSELKSYRRMSGLQSGSMVSNSKTPTPAQGLIITELVMPSARVLPLFTQCKILKESYLKFSEAKEVLTNYIRSHDLADKDNSRKEAYLKFSEAKEVLTNYISLHDLADKDNSRLIVLDPLLCDVLRNKGNPPDEKLTWQEANQRLIELMRPAYSIQWPGKDIVIRKGKLQPIKLTVCQRASNKKVTLVDNLECYGVSPVDFAHSMQKLAAASTTTTQLPGKSAGMQALVQGNTAKLATKIIHEQYGIPLKFIETVDMVKPKVSTPKKRK